MASQLKILTPSRIGNLKIKNRVVRSSTYYGMATEKGQVTDRLISIIEKLAKSEIGLIDLGYAYVMENGKAIPRQLGIYDDSLVPGLKKLVAGVKNSNGEVKIFAQIAHAGRQIFATSDIFAPSAIPDKLIGTVPKEMTPNDINDCVKSFINGARRAHEAGFDGVQLHCAHGYLLSEFMSPYCNVRTDSYGGSIENRFRIIKEIILGIQDIDKNFPITAKLNVGDHVGPIKPQLTIDESKFFAKMMADLGVCAIETSGGLYESAMHGNLTPSRTKIKTPADEAYYLSEAKIIKEIITNTPVILVGGIKSLETAENALKEGIDFISLSRPLIREPDLIIKWKNGTSTTAECISCNRCLLDLSPKGVRCIVLEKLEKKKKRTEG